MLNKKQLKFHEEVDQTLYRKSYPPLTDNKLYKHEMDALSSAWGLMNDFTHIEKGLARIIVSSLGLDNPHPWKEISYKIGKEFSASQMIDMVEDLISLGNLELSDRNKVKLPSDFKNKELDYFQACRIGMQYRNELAHTGFIFLSGNITIIFIILLL